MGTSGDIIGRYERDEVTPSVEVAAKMVEALGVKLDYLVKDGEYEQIGIAIVNRRLFKQLFPFPFLAHQASCTQLLNGACFYCTIPQYT